MKKQDDKNTEQPILIGSSGTYGSDSNDEIKK